MWIYELLSGSDLRRKIKSGRIQFGGNFRLKIYGTLSCASGKRMKKQNQVFFVNEKEALELGFRPCGHCLRKKYNAWKSKNQVENQAHQPQI